MRIIAGSVKGRKLISPGRTSGKQAIRPTADRNREALFSILGSRTRIEGKQVLDLFAGTGAFGLEALSRGADNALMIDASPNAIQLIRRNIELCDFKHNAFVLKCDLRRGFSIPPSLAPDGGFSLIFLDPPYGKGLGERVLRQLATGEVLSHEAIVVVEDKAKENNPEKIEKLQLFDQRRYGETGFWLYAVTE